MRKFLLSLLLAATVAAPVFAGNSIRLQRKVNYEGTTGLGDPSVDNVCVDGDVNDVVVLDDFEALDDGFIGDRFGANTCDVDRDVTSVNIASPSTATYNMHVMNHMLEGATSSNEPEINTLFESHLDSVIDGNFLGLARYYNVGAGDLAVPYGMEMGALGFFAWDGDSLQLQTDIRGFIDLPMGPGGSIPDNTAYGSLGFSHGNGTGLNSYADSAIARYDLDWEFYDDVFINSGLLGFGNVAEASATCIHDDTDELFGDRDCDETVDTAENPLDTYYLEVADGAGATSHFSGLELGGADWNDLALLQGCADTEVLAWDDGNSWWECASAGASLWTDGGTETYLTATGDRVLVGESTATETAKVHIKGEASLNAPVLTLSMNTGSTTSPFMIRDSGGGALAQVANTGLIITKVGLDAEGASDLDYGSADVTDHTFITDGTGDSEFVVPDNSIGPDEVLADTCFHYNARQVDAIESSFAALGTDTTGSNVSIRYRAFDQGTDEYVNGEVIVPDTLASSGNVTITLWTRASAVGCAAACDGIWSFDYVGRDDAESYDAAYTSSAFATETYTASDDTTLVEVSQTIAVGSFTAGDLLFWRVFRDADNASDNYAGDLHVLAVEICFP